MDTLALLCNLHADGPETLQLLRRAGWDTLAEIESVAAGELASVLETSAERATRFQREARHLRERLEGAGDDAPARSRPSPRTPPPPGEGAELEVPARDVLIPHSVPWSGRGGGPLEAVPPLPEPALPVPPSAEEPAARAPKPAPKPEPAAKGIAAGAIDGMDVATAERLAAADVGSLAELAAAVPLELAARSGVDYTRLLRLQFLARRAAPAEPSRRSDARGERDTDGPVAGPFA